MGKKALKITDIADMIYLADGIVFGARWEFMYGENGERLSPNEMDEQIEKDRKNGIGGLVEKFLHSFHDLTEAIELTPEYILEKLSPIKSRVLGIFRSGDVYTEVTIEFCADDSVPDEWLLELFAMRIRDKIISFVMQEEAAKRAAERGSK